MDLPMATRSTVLADWDGAPGASVEFGAPHEIAALQSRLLARHVEHCARNSPFYREMFARLGVAPEEIRTPADLARLPLTTKDDLIARNSDFLAVEPEAIVDVCFTSATVGPVPITVELTASDLARLGHNEEMAFSLIDIGPRDTLHICAALDRCFMAGLAYFLGGLRCGARVVRGGSGSAAQHWQQMRRTPPTVLVGVPSLMLRIARCAEEQGERPNALGVRALIAIGEATRDGAMNLLPTAAHLEDRWGCPIYSTYASTELATTFCECKERRGGHLRPELIIVEILNERGEPVASGAEGEVVATPLGVEGTPLLRYQTGDIARLIEEPCVCGRNTPRLGPIRGRKNQMLKVKGTTIFPGAIISALETLQGVAGCCVEAHRSPDGGDRVTVHVACDSDDVTADKLASHVAAHTRVTPEIQRITVEALTAMIVMPGKRKPVTFLDRR